MRKLLFPRKFIAFFFASALIVSCTTEVDWKTKIDNLKFDQTIVLPIGSAKVTLADLFSKIDSSAILKSEGVHFYISSRDTINWNIKQIPSLGSAIPTQLDFNPLYGGTDEGEIRSFELSPYELDLDVNSDTAKQRLDSIIANSAKIGISVSKENAVMQPRDIKIILNFAPDRVKFSNSGTKPSFTPNFFGQTEDLTISDKFSIYLPNATSKVPLSLRIEIKKNGTVFNANSKVTVNLKYTQINTKVLYGYYQPELTSNEEVIDISDLTKDLPKNAKLKFTEPEIKFDIRNNLGVKVGFHIDELKAYLASDTTKSVIAQFDGSSHKLIVLNRKNKFDDQPVNTIYTMNNTIANGSIQNFFSADFIPDRLRYKYHVDNQAESKYPNPADFYAPGIPFETYVYAKLPLKFAGGSYVEYTDSIKDVKIDTTTINDKYIAKAQLLIKITNKLPVKVQATLKFLSSTGDTLNLGNVVNVPEIPAATTNANGEVTETPSPVTISIDVSNENLSELTKLNKIVYTVRVDSKDSTTPIIFHKDNSVEIKAGLFAKGNATLKSIR